MCDLVELGDFAAKFANLVYSVRTTMASNKLIHDLVKQLLDDICFRTLYKLKQPGKIHIDFITVQRFLQATT